MKDTTELVEKVFHIGLIVNNIIQHTKSFDNFQELRVSFFI